LLTVGYPSDPIQEFAELPIRDRFGRIFSDGAAALLDQSEGRIFALRPLKVGAVKCNAIICGFQLDSRRWLDASGMWESCAHRRVVSPLPATGMEKQIVELPEAEAGVGVLGANTVVTNRAGSAGVDQQTEQRRHGLGWQIGNATTDIGRRTRFGQGVNQCRRPWIVEHDSGGR
jgi:hypothetical protein